jgi:3-oxoacyl-[acyl-carrier protein] reductase
MLDDLKTKRVLVTGASSGIGAAVARGFARAGAKVAIHYNSHKDEAEAVAADIRSLGGEVHLAQADLGVPSQAAPMIVEAAAQLGGLDILVNNAGAMMTRTLMTDWTDALFDEVMNLNVRSVLNATLAAVPYMEKAGGGAVVNLGSIAGVNGGGPGSGMYASAKAFIHNVTRHMATDLAKKHIRVNAIAPGVVKTPFHDQTPPERMKIMQASIPMGRLGAPEDCVGPVLFLASDTMSGYMTGQILHINGGQFYGG